MAVTTNFAFTKLVGTDYAGYSTINALIDSIDSILNARIPASAAAASVIGRSAATAGATAAIASTADGQLLQRTSGVLAWATYAGHTVVANLAARPASPVAGQMIYQTDTDEVLKYVVDQDSISRWMQADHDSNRNLVVNGGFDVWQRGTSATVSTADFYGPADRWQTTRLSVDTGRTFSRQPVTNSDTPVSAFTYFMRCQRTAANAATNTILMTTSFETTSVRRTQNKYVTLSFFARAGSNYSAASGFLRAYITTGTGTDGRLITGNFTSPTTLVDSNNVLTTSWKRFTVTTSAAVGSTVTQMGVSFQFDPVGTAGASDYYDITGVQVELGSAPSDFEFRDAGEELRRCQRYYYRIQATANSQTGVFGNGYNISTTVAQINTIFPTIMRTSPTAVEQSGTPSNYAIASPSATAQGLTTNPSFNSASQYNAFTSITTAATLTAAQPSVGSSGSVAGTSAYLGWSAEL